MFLIDKIIDQEALKNFLRDFFPEITISPLLEDGNNTANHNELFFLIEVNESSIFSLNFILFGVSEAELLKLQPIIATNLSQNFGAKVLVDFKNPKEPNNPYYSLLFDRGKCFLVSDVDWEEKGAIHIIKPWEIK